MRVDSKILKSNNDKYVVIVIKEVSDKCDKFMIRFDENVEIISSSSGYIKSGVLVVTEPVREIEVVISTPIHIIKTSVSLTSYLGTQIKTESLDIILPAMKTQHKSNIIRNISINLPSYKDTDQYLKTANLSSWTLNLSINENIYIDITKTDDRESIYVCFGDMSSIISSGDLVFVLNKDYPVIIPKEIPWIKHKEYKGYILGCFEIVSLDCDPINNIFYKVPISNALNTSDLSSKNSIDLNNTTREFFKKT